MEAYTAEDASWKSLLYRRSCSRCDSVRWKPVFGKASLAESWNSMPNTFCSSLRIRGTHVSAALAAVDAVESVEGDGVAGAAAWAWILVGNVNECGACFSKEIYAYPFR